MPARTTIYLDEQLLLRTRRFIAERGMSQLVSELLEQYVADRERVELEAQLCDGYLAIKEERADVEYDWSPIDTEKWPA
jgi:metal-responsive CopG/Arc/MetJ family transcriptional regulator